MASQTAPAAAAEVTPVAAGLLTEPLGTQLSGLPGQAGDVLSFWYPGLEAGEEPPFQSMWFSSTPEDDEKMRQQFGALVATALEGGLEDWEGSHAGCLAKILLLDQFTRNLHRGTAQAFAGDAEAQRLTAKLLEEDPAFSSRSTLPVCVRTFALMPFMHAEDVAMNKRLIEEFSLATFGSPSREAFMRSAWDHVAVTLRFGRYPHRNQVLDRTSTEAEVAYLTDPDAHSWGQ